MYSSNIAVLTFTYTLRTEESGIEIPDEALDEREDEEFHQDALKKELDKIHELESLPLDDDENQKID